MIFTENKETNLYTSVLGNTPKGDADAFVKTGGSSLTKFVPNINASKWDDECWLNINNRAVDVRGEAQTFVNGKIDLVVGNDCHRYYIKPDGHLEYEIIFSEQPKPEIPLDLQFSKGLDFFYQPALTEEEITEGCSRPGNVVGSYAAYFNKAWNKYQTGKYCHIYRPLIYDSAGNKTWGTVIVDPSAGVVVYRCDEGWLKNAKYPIVLDPTFGFESEGGSAFTLNNGLTPVANIVDTYTAAAGKSMKSFSLYSTSASGTQNYVAAAYTYAGGVPTARLASQVNVTINTSLNWYSSEAVEQVLAEGTVYCTGWTIANTGVNSSIYYDAGSAPGRLNAVAGTLGTLADPFGAVGTDSGRHYSMYGTYDASAAGGLSIPNPFHRPLLGPLGGCL